MNTTTAIGVPLSWARNLSINESINSGAANGSSGQVLEPAAVRIFRLAIQTFLFVTGVLGNVLVCIVTSRKRNLKIVGNRFILHLAVADLGILLVSFPLLVIRIEFQFSWPFGDIICRTAYPFTDIFYGVEIGCITAIAMHRYRMLVHCMKPQMSVRKAGYVVALTWAASFAVIVVPLFFAMQLVPPKSGALHSLECIPMWPKPIVEQIYVVVNVILLYVIPLVIILVTYLRIRTKLKESIEIHNSYRLKSCTGSLERHNEILARIAQNERAMKLLTPVVLIFALTMFPLNLYRLFAPFIPSIRTYEYMPFIFRFFSILMVANSMANPVVYSVVNTEFRREFLLLLRCRRCRPCCRTPTSGLKTTTSATKSGIRRSSSSRRSSSNSQLRKWSISKSGTASSWLWKRGSLSTASSALSGSADSKRKRKQRKEKVKLVVL